MKIGIIDYGVGNLRSIQKAIECFNGNAIISAEVNELKNCNKYILPGVGAFKFCKEQLKHKFDDINSILQNKSVLGICIGMQILFDYSLEFEKTPGLGLINGCVEKLESTELPIPNNGWNKIILVKKLESSSLFKDLNPNNCYYFNHSYSCQPTDRLCNMGYTYYGQKFISVVQKNNLYGVQFHPEKSGKAGIKLLKNFYNLC